MNLYLEKPWMYDPNFLMDWLKGNKSREPNDHESRPVEEMLAKEHSWMEVMQRKCRGSARKGTFMDGGNGYYGNR